MIDLVSLWVGRIVVYSSAIVAVLFLLGSVIVEIFGLISIIKHYWFVGRFLVPINKMPIWGIWKMFSLAWELGNGVSYGGFGWNIYQKFGLPFFFKADDYEYAKSMRFKRDVSSL